MDWIAIIVKILSGLIIIIPLVAELVKYVKKSIKEKNWSKLLELILKLMAEAETKFDTGATRKEWVLAMVQASADTINYEVNIKEVSDLIDNLCKMSKTVNAESKKK